MSAAATRSASEGISSPPVFSYAQAAKGRSPSLSTAPQVDKTRSESTDATLRRPSPHQAAPESAVEDVIMTRRTSEGQAEKIDAKDLTMETNQQLDPTPTLETAQNPPQQAVDTQSQTPNSPPSSPGFGSTSASTLHKEDDAFTTPNGSSESTWDKVSQSSQNPERTEVKTEGDEDVQLSLWEEVPVPVSLKEAPPPAFNIWQKRALDAQAKVGKDTRPAFGTVTVPIKDGSLPRGGKPSNHVSESGKTDGKRRAKGSPATDEKTVSPGAKESAKPGDGRYRVTEEGKEKKMSNGVRLSETTKPTVNSAPPPPPGDAISWPTPDIAQEGEKKKSQDRGDKIEGEKLSASKPHGKEKWVTVPFVPTVQFNTPLPPNRRGGRSARGGRDSGSRGSHTAHGSISGTEPSSSTPANLTAAPAATLPERARGDMGPPRGGPLSSRPKRAASAGPPTSREHRRVTDPSLPERRDESSTIEQRPAQSSRASPTENRRTSIATQTDSAQNGGPISPTSFRSDVHGGRRQSPNGGDHESGQQGNSQDHAHPRSTPERRSEGSIRSSELVRGDYNSFAYTRDRGEGRPERGRGGFRGRGGHNGFSGPQLANGQSSSSHQSNQHLPTGYTPSKSQSFNERQTAQPQVPPFVPPRQETRGHRGNSRSQSIPNPTGYGRFPNGGPPPGTQHLPSLQTDVASMYGFPQGPPTIMSAMPYQPYEQMQLIGMVQMQMEYYFSLDNLCKDMFLRKHMDSQGFVYLGVLIKFNRIRQLTSDIDLIRYVCRVSPEIDIQTGMDGMDRVRKADGWQPWVLGTEERDSSARNDIPVQMMQHSQFVPFATHDQYRGQGATSVLSPGSSSFTVAPNRTGATPPIQATNSTSPVKNARIASNTSPHEPNGYINGQFTQTPLSAAVPDFTPGLHNLSTNVLPTLEPHGGTENSFSDEQVESLMIVIRKPYNPANPVRAPFQSASSRTFSNGSIDRHTIVNEVSSLKEERSTPPVNGSRTPENCDQDGLQRSRSPFAIGSPSKQSNSVPSPVFWVKDQDAPIDDLPNDLTHESYMVFRHNALKQREQSPKGQCHRDMDILYQFWSHFLIRNFNTRMYEEFRHLSFEDFSSRNSVVGVRNLALYYDESILGQKVISDDLARDYVQLVKSEGGRKDRIAFDKLRSALRNGALNLKNRVKIDKILDSDLKAELER